MVCYRLEVDPCVLLIVNPLECTGRIFAKSLDYAKRRPFDSAPLRSVAQRVRDALLGLKPELYDPPPLSLGSRRSRMASPNMFRQ